MNLEKPYNKYAIDVVDKNIVACEAIYRYIYKITCTAGSFKGLFYYGQHTTDNLDDGYKGSGSLLLKYYKKYPNDYIKEIISFHNSQEELNQAEYDIIHTWLGNPKCLNIKEGGEGGSFKGINKGRHLSEEHKKKISLKEKGISKPCSEQHRQALIESWKNRPRVCSEETRQKISESLKGRHLSEEHKQKVSKKLKGQPFTEERKQKISEALKAFYLLEEHKQKISESHKGKTPWNKGIKLAWITLNNNHKQIKEEELQKYIDAGWHRGMK